MKIICEKEKLMKALNSVTKAVATRTTNPILEGILIQTNTNEVKFTTSDSELSIEYIIEANVQEEGSTVVNATMFTEIIRKLPDTEITIYINENNLLVIECESSVYKLSIMNPENYPEIPQIDVENSITLEQNVLKDMIRKTIFCVSSEENRPIITGCLFEVIDNKLNVVAVDGYRLAWRYKELSYKNNFNAVIPGRSLNEINKIILDSFDQIKIGISKNQALFEIENCKIVTTLLTGEFLKYENAIPNNLDTKIIVSKNDLLERFERVSLISSSTIEREKKHPVKVSIEPGKVVLSCQNQTGDAKEDLLVQTEGKTLEIGFNPKYFIDALKAIDDEEIQICYGTSISPAIIKGVNTDEYLYMILPIRLKEN